MDTLKPRSADRVLVDVKPRCCPVGPPRLVAGARSPQRHSIEADKELFVVPHGGKCIFDAGEGPDVPLCIAVTDAVTGEDSAVYRCRPPVVVPGGSVVSVDSGAVVSVEAAVVVVSSLSSLLHAAATRANTAMRMMNLSRFIRFSLVVLSICYSSHEGSVFDDISR